MKKSFFRSVIHFFRFSRPDTCSFFGIATSSTQGTAAYRRLFWLVRSVSRLRVRPLPATMAESRILPIWTSVKPRSSMAALRTVSVSQSMG